MTPKDTSQSLSPFSFLAVSRRATSFLTSVILPSNISNAVGSLFLSVNTVESFVTIRILLLITVSVFSFTVMSEPLGSEPVGYAAVTLGGHHAGPHGVHRLADLPEHGTLLRPDQSPEDVSALASLGLSLHLWGELQDVLVHLRRIMILEFGLQGQCALGDHGESPPGAVHGGEGVLHQLHGLGVALRPHETGVLVLDLRPSVPDLLAEHVAGHQDVQGLESRDDLGNGMGLGELVEHARTGDDGHVSGLDQTVEMGLPETEDRVQDGRADPVAAVDAE